MKTTTEQTTKIWITNIKQIAFYIMNNVHPIDTMLINNGTLSVAFAKDEECRQIYKLWNKNKDNLN